MQDRLARLMRDLHLFQATGVHGLTSAELAERMGISQRQAQRDIEALVSTRDDGRTTRRRLMPGPRTRSGVLDVALHNSCAQPGWHMTALTSSVAL